MPSQPYHCQFLWTSIEYWTTILTAIYLWISYEEDGCTISQNHNCNSGQLVCCELPIHWIVKVELQRPNKQWVLLNALYNCTCKKIDLWRKGSSCTCAFGCRLLLDFQVAYPFWRQWGWTGAGLCQWQWGEWHYRRGSNISLKLLSRGTPDGSSCTTSTIIKMWRVSGQSTLSVCASLCGHKGWSLAWSLSFKSILD